MKKRQASLKSQTNETNLGLRSLFIFFTFIFGATFFLLSNTNNNDIIANNVTKQEPAQKSQAQAILNTKQDTPPPHFIDSLEGVAKWQKITINKGDSILKILSQYNIKKKSIAKIVTITKLDKRFKNIMPGQELYLNIADDEYVDELRYNYKIDQAIILKRHNEDYQIALVKNHLETILQYGEATINNSLFLAGLKAGLTDKTIMDLAFIFGWDIDFVLDIRPGDKFRLLYEESYINGKKVSVGQILAAEFINNHKVFKAVRFTDKNSRTDYYNEKGVSLRKEFIRAPLKFSRISSRFTRARYHPIMHKIRSHKGVDYAAARGTPIKATGDGKVVFVGKKGGYGNAIIIKHGARYQTLYGHLHKFARRTRVNAKVKQGQIIGYVGSTGLATGPHLHYEFHINGRHHDPLKVKFTKTKPVSKKARPLFSAVSNKVFKILDQYSNNGRS